MLFSRPDRRALSRLLAATALLSGVAACGTVVLNSTGSLTRYDRLERSTSTATEARLFIDRPAVERARTVRIIPTAFPANVEGSAPLTAADRRLIANNADRALCYDLSLKYDVVTSRDADLTVRAQVTRVEPTNLIGAGTTIAGSAAVTIASQVGVGFAEGIGRIPIPRVPIGLGSLTVEAEALDRHHQQRAAMIWGGARIPSPASRASRRPAIPMTSLAISARISATCSPGARIRSRPPTPCRRGTASA